MFKSLRFSKYTDNQGEKALLLSSSNKVEFLYFLQMQKIQWPLQYSKYYKSWYVRVPSQQATKVKGILSQLQKISEK